MGGRSRHAAARRILAAPREETASGPPRGNRRRTEERSAISRFTQTSATLGAKRRHSCGIRDRPSIGRPVGCEAARRPRSPAPKVPVFSPARTCKPRYQAYKTSPRHTNEREAVFAGRACPVVKKKRKTKKRKKKKVSSLGTVSTDP